MKHTLGKNITLAAIAMAATLILGVVVPTSAVAASAKKDTKATSGTITATDMSAQRWRGGYRGVYRAGYGARMGGYGRRLAYRSGYGGYGYGAPLGYGGGYYGARPYLGGYGYRRAVRYAYRPRIVNPYYYNSYVAYPAYYPAYRPYYAPAPFIGIGFGGIGFGGIGFGPRHFW